VSATTIEFGQLPALLLRAPDGAEATITLYGAHLVSWKPSPRPAPAAGTHVHEPPVGARRQPRHPRRRAGDLPQFAERGDGMRHGFARVSTWRLLDSGEQDGAAFAVLG
jgi:glucose-6-phosphate 1-epimerase